MPNTSHVFVHLILTLTWNWQLLLTHFKEEEIEAEKGSLTSPTSHSSK